MLLPKVLLKVGRKLALIAGMGINPLYIERETSDIGMVKIDIYIFLAFFNEMKCFVFQIYKIFWWPFASFYYFSTP